MRNILVESVGEHTERSALLHMLHGFLCVFTALSIQNVSYNCERLIG